METLRTELLESQKARNDLMKWKLLIVVSIGGAGLGFSEKGPGSAHFALVVLPLACAYIDLLCRNLSLRAKTIGLFYEYDAHAVKHLRAWQDFHGDIYDNAWRGVSLESWALLWSTVLISCAVLPTGILTGNASWHPFSWPAGIFYGSSVLGLVLALTIENKYRKLMDKAITCATKKRAQQHHGSTPAAARSMGKDEVQANEATA